ncbi:MAG: signal peptidase I [Gammaproteobacteria bacterium]
MKFDFPVIMVLAVVLTGVIWLVDAVFLAPRRRLAQAHLLAATGPDATAGPQATAELMARLPKEPLIVEYARSFFPVILAVLVLRSFIVEPFRIPSNSMMPTLLTGDFILVNKFKYGIRLPVIDKKIIDVGLPQRGDVVVFRYPNDPSIDYIKRVIGLPGDRVAYYRKQLRINGEIMAQQGVGPYTGVGAGVGMTGADMYKESLGKIEHSILTRAGQSSVEGEFVVPPGEYFVMGDNRDNSNDSRYWGTVPEQNLVGKAFLVWMNLDASNGGVAWGRIGSSIR